MTSDASLPHLWAQANADYWRERAEAAERLAAERKLMIWRLRDALRVAAQYEVGPFGMTVAEADDRVRAALAAMEEPDD